MRKRGKKTQRTTGGVSPFIAAIARNAPIEAKVATEIMAATYISLSMLRDGCGNLNYLIKLTYVCATVSLLCRLGYGAEHEQTVHKAMLDLGDYAGDEDFRGFPPVSGEAYESLRDTLALMEAQLAVVPRAVLKAAHQQVLPSIEAMASAEQVDALLAA